MRPPSSVEQPAEAKMSATKASSAFALMVTVIVRAPNEWPHPEERSAGVRRDPRGVTSALWWATARRVATLRDAALRAAPQGEDVLLRLRLFLRRGALQVADIAAVPGRIDHDLVDHDVRRQAGHIADEVADI